MLKKGLIAGCFLLALGVFLVARNWDSPELGRAVLTRVGDATGGNAAQAARGFLDRQLRGR